MWKTLTKLETNVPFGKQLTTTTHLKRPKQNDTTTTLLRASMQTCKWRIKHNLASHIPVGRSSDKGGGPISGELSSDLRLVGFWN